MIKSLKTKYSNKTSKDDKPIKGKKSKKVLAIFGVGVVLLGFSVYQLYNIVVVPQMTFRNAGQALSKEQTYAVSTTIDVPDGTATYVEVTTPDGNYSEYPYTKSSSNSNVTESKNDSYLLHDWLTKDGKLYELNTSFKSGDDKSTMWLALPDDYAKSLSSRKTMYSDILSPAVHDLKKKDIESMNLGLSGNKDVQLYTCTVGSSAIKQILQKDSYDMYKAILTEGKNKGDKNVTNWLDTKIKTLDRNLTFSDGDMTFGIYDGKLVYYRLEFGGLGSSMVITKHLILSEFQKRALPDFSSTSKTYYESAKSFADAVAQYGGEEEATKALSESQKQVPTTPDAGVTKTETAPSTKK